MNSFNMKAENGENNGSSINNSASDMSDDESSTLAMINSKKLREMMPARNEEQSRMMTPFNKELFLKFQEKFFNMQQQVGSDLLGNLLSCDQGVLNRMLSSSADEAAMLLGVKK